MTVVPIKVDRRDGTFSCVIYAVMDSGSTISFKSASLQQEIGCQGVKENSEWLPKYVAFNIKRDIYRSKELYSWFKHDIIPSSHPSIMTRTNMMDYHK